MKRLLLLFCLVTLSQITFSQDDDGDGISNSLESSFGLDPNDCDTDDDGLNDYEDYFDFNCDPLSADTDGDGVQDGTEAGITFGCADTDLGIFILGLRRIQITLIPILTGSLMVMRTSIITVLMTEEQKPMLLTWTQIWMDYWTGRKFLFI